MIVLDTNVISETMRTQPDLTVLEWLNRQVAETIYISSISVAELHFGIGALPAGRRKEELSRILSGVLALFAGRILSFDADAALIYAKLAVAARNSGKGFPTPDGYIAAIAKSRNFAIATRDHAPFEAVGLKVINPWQA
jgi:toxin FitB